jgi:hypothetical protein
VLQENQKPNEVISDLRKLGSAKDEFIRNKAKQVERVQEELGILKSMHAREIERFRNEITNSAVAAVCQARSNSLLKPWIPTLTRALGILRVGSRG